MSTYSISPSMADPGLIPWVKNPTVPKGCESLKCEWWLWHSEAPENYVGVNRYPAIKEPWGDFLSIPIGIGYEAGNPGDADQISGKRAVDIWRQIEPLLGFRPAYLTFDEPCSHLMGVSTNYLQLGADSAVRVAEELGYDIHHYEAYPRLTAAALGLTVEDIATRTNHLKRFVMDIDFNSFDHQRWQTWLQDVDCVRQRCHDYGVEFAMSITGQKTKWNEPEHHTDETFTRQSLAYYGHIKDHTDRVTIEGGWEDSITGKRDVPSIGALVGIAQTLFPQQPEEPDVPNDEPCQVYISTDWHDIGVEVDRLMRKHGEDNPRRVGTLFKRFHDWGDDWLVWEQLVDRVEQSMWPTPGPPTGDGMAHSLRGGVGQVIGGWEGEWFANSRLIHRMSDDAVRTWARAYRSRGNTHMWVSLSTGNRPSMNETIFNALHEQQQVLDRLDLLISLGIQPVIELATQEACRQWLGTGGGQTVAAANYMETAAYLVRGRCKLLMPTRELTDFELWGNGTPGNDRVKWANMLLKAAERGAGPGVGIGVHLTAFEAPPRGMYSNLTNPYWLAQWGFDYPVDSLIPLDDDNHVTQQWDAARWHQYWAVNRGIPTIAFEHSLPTNPAGYRGVSAAVAKTRGQYILKNAPAVIADMSGGASR